MPALRRASGTIDCREPVSQLLYDRVVKLLVGERLRWIGDVAATLGRRASAFAAFPSKILQCLLDALAFTG